MQYFFICQISPGHNETDCYPASNLPQPSAEMWFSPYLWINELIKDWLVKEVKQKEKKKQKIEQQAVEG